MRIGDLNLSQDALYSRYLLFIDRPNFIYFVFYNAQVKIFHIGFTILQSRPNLSRFILFAVVAAAFITICYYPKNPSKMTPFLPRANRRASVRPPTLSLYYVIISDFPLSSAIVITVRP